MLQSTMGPGGAGGRRKHPYMYSFCYPQEGTPQASGSSDLPLPQTLQDGYDPLSHAVRSVLSCSTLRGGGPRHSLGAPALLPSQRCATPALDFRDTERTKAPSAPKTSSNPDGEADAEQRMRMWRDKLDSGPRLPADQQLPRVE